MWPHTDTHTHTMHVQAVPAAAEPMERKRLQSWPACLVTSSATKAEAHEQRTVHAGEPCRRVTMDRRNSRHGKPGRGQGKSTGHVQRYLRGRHTELKKKKKIYLYTYSFADWRALVGFIWAMLLGQITAGFQGSIINGFKDLLIQ